MLHNAPDCWFVTKVSDIERIIIKGNLLRDIVGPTHCWNRLLFIGERTPFNKIFLIKLLVHLSLYFSVISVTSSMRPSSRVRGLRPKLQNFLFDTCKIMTGEVGRDNCMILVPSILAFHMFSCCCSCFHTSTTHFCVGD